MKSDKVEFKNICAYKKCENEFSTANKFKIYCCVKCRRRANYCTSTSVKKEYNRICAYIKCENKLTTRMKTKIYCSKKCRDRANKVIVLKEEHTKFCEFKNCRKPFSTTNEHRKYCCKKCKRKANYHPRAKKIYLQICENCKKEFVAKREDNKFCSIPCKDRFNYLKNRETLLEKSKIRYNQTEKPRYQENKERINKINYDRFVKIYQECEDRMNEDIITNMTITHKIFSYLNHHPDAKYREVKKKFPRLHIKQCAFSHYFWIKITKEKYDLGLTEQEKQLINKKTMIFQKTT